MLKIRKHHTPNYIFNKIRRIYFELTNPQLPWLTEESIKLLNQLILKTDVGLEFGSGRSTKWLAAKCRKLFSVENNRLWFEKVSADLTGYSNVEYLFGNINQTDREASSYLAVLDSIANDSLDFILNDGRVRDLVAAKSLPKLKEGGVFILDNAERYLPNTFSIPESIGERDSFGGLWQEFYLQTKTWRRIWTCDGVTSTLILFKG